MEKLPHSLDWIIVGLALVATAVAYKQAFASIANTPKGSRKPLYKFDKSKLPVCFYITVSALVLSLCIGKLVTNRISEMIQFSAVSTILVAIDSVLALAYVRISKM